jgi:hypothetical protein
MYAILRVLILLGIVASAATFLAAAWAWWNEEDRRLRRLAGKVLGGYPDGVIVARGRNAAAAFRLDAGQVLVMRDGGARALLYPMRRLEGAELIIDGEVAARAMRGEPRRALDRVPSESHRVTLRLVFDDAANPDFDLDLWLPVDALRRNAAPPAAAIEEARGWLARAEAILRRAEAAPMPTTVQAHVAEPEFDLDDEIEDEFDDDEAVEAPVAAAPAPTAAAPQAPEPKPVGETDDGLPLPPLDQPIQPYLL